MTTLGKTLFVILSLGALFGATLLLRAERDVPVKAAQLTPAQRAEMQPAPKPAEPPQATAPKADRDDDPADPPDLDAEDGSGS